MKRTNLVLNEDLLEEATRLSGERTYSRAVERALEDFVRRAKARRILELSGSGLWQGDLSVVRDFAGLSKSRRSDARARLGGSLVVAISRPSPVRRSWSRAPRQRFR